MKKICFLNGNMSRAGGTERVTSMIANELVKDSAYEIHVLSVTNPTMTSFFELHPFVYQATLLRKGDVDLKYDYFKIVKTLRQYLKTHQIDILIEVDVICNLYTIPATRWTKVKTISWEHFNYYSNNGSRLRDFSRKLTKYFSTHIVTLTEQDRRNYQEYLGIKDKITCIYNPIEKIPETTYRSESKQIISVGQLRHIKGFDILCEVAKEVLPKHPGWTWLIIGEGAERPMLEKKIKEYHLEGRLVLTGNQKEMSHYYQDSSFFVMTSRYEGLPMTLLEAKSYQLPIVSFDCQTGPAELILSSENGYLVDMGDCKMMEQKVTELIENPSLRVRFSSNTLKDIKRFEMDEVIRKWISLLEGV
ncbi:glycosyltransferase family 4 protein [Turicibacter sp. KK003]|uniref:glycosyltransferase family 4 protein n=1 Tax=Turicibacter sp. KK003 TaxID=3114695 RepID=UPI0030D08913